jgi:hypothetical protein
MSKLELFSRLAILTIATVLIGFSAANTPEVPVCQQCTAGSAAWGIGSSLCQGGATVRSVDDTGITCIANAPCSLTGTISVGALCTEDVCVTFIATYVGSPSCGGTGSSSHTSGPFSWTIDDGGGDATDITCNAGAPWCQRSVGVIFMAQSNLCTSVNAAWHRIWTCSQ